MKNNFSAVCIFFQHSLDLSSVCWTFISHSFTLQFYIVHNKNELFHELPPIYSISFSFSSFFLQFYNASNKGEFNPVVYWSKGEKENKCCFCCCFSTVSAVCGTKFCCRRQTTVAHIHTKNDAVLLLNDNWVQWTLWLEQ